MYGREVGGWRARTMRRAKGDRIPSRRPPCGHWRPWLWSNRAVPLVGQQAVVASLGCVCDRSRGVLF